MRIGILTGGGDVPGLNSVIKGVVYRGTENDCEVVGIRRGWEGLTHVNFDVYAVRCGNLIARGRHQCVISANMIEPNVHLIGEAVCPQWSNGVICGISLPETNAAAEKHGCEQ